jgi:threonine dehydrogenase-like Zn-dependent dehydrogenase
MDFMATQPRYRGALTDYLVHPARFTYHLPDDMDFTQGALVEPAAVGMHAAKLAGVAPGVKVCILGAGCIGLMTLQACILLGADGALVSDVIPGRLAMARRFGAAMAVDGKDPDAQGQMMSFFDGQGADVVFETAGSPATAALALRLVKRGGQVMVVGTIPGETPVEFLKINREVSVRTVFRYAGEFPQTIDAIHTGAFDVNSMVTRTYGYEEAQRAFDEAVQDKDHIIKSVVHMPGFAADR